MFSHIVLGAGDVKVAKQFYNAVLAPLGHGSDQEIPELNRVIYRGETGSFVITKPLGGKASTG